MNRFRKLLFTICLMMSLLLPTSISSAMASHVAPPDLTAKGAVLIDMKTGQILYEHNKDMKLYPASITKIMTCILALENGHLDDLVTTSQLARNQDGNRVYLEVGEKETLRQMLYGLMLNSGNDAAVAIAEHIGGSVQGFANMMNEKAAELGAHNTHFANPNGLHDDNHYTTAYDMALIANYAMKNPQFRELVSTKTYDWHGQSWDSRLVNINPMLWNYDGATGVKTGFTDQAQQTMVVSAKHGDREIMAVLMDVVGKPLIRQEATALLDYGFNQFTQQRLSVSGDVLGSYAKNGYTVHAVLHRDVYADFPADDSNPEVQHTVHLNPPPAPFPKGSTIGTVNYTVNGQTVATADLVASGDVLLPTPKQQAVTALVKSHPLYWLPVLLLLLVPLIRHFRKNNLTTKSTSHTG